MASDEDIELTQTQSQTVEENYFTQSAPTDERDIWGRLTNRHQSFRSVGEIFYSIFLAFYTLMKKIPYRPHVSKHMLK